MASATDDEFYTRFLNYISEIDSMHNRAEGSSMPAQVEYYKDLLKSRPNIKRIAEIGFNVGFGAAAFLAVRPDVEVISFDICAHDHVTKIKKVLDKHFPNRHSLICGDSTQSVPMLRRFFGNFAPVDLFFVDGYHRDPVPYIDICNALDWCGPESLIMVDDVCEAHGSEGVVQAVVRAAQENKFKILEHKMDGDRGWILAKKL